MKYRRLGKTNLLISVVGLGTHQFGGAWGQDYSQIEVDQLLGEAHDLGINFLDTAACYGPHRSEKLIGKALLNQRQNWILATKFGRSWTPGHGVVCNFTQPAVASQLEASLKALKTDYIDIYQFHSGTNAEFNDDELWTFLDKQVQSGTIRHLGISISGPLSNMNDTHQTIQADTVKAGVVQVVYNRMNENVANDILPLCKKNNIGVLARIPLAKGFLSGKYSIDTEFPNGDHRSQYDPKFNRELLSQAAIIREQEVPDGMEMSQWAIAWCLAHPAITAVIPGARNLEQLRSNAAAANLPSVSQEHPLAEDGKGILV